mgnify:CR=1 FL=1
MSRFNVKEEFTETLLEGGGRRRDYEDGREFWENGEGEYHREDGPAITLPGGGEYYYLNGRRYKSEKEWKEELWKRNIKKIVGE